MRKFLLCMVLVVATTAATAQHDGDGLHWQGFETNRFWDNWEISVGGGNTFLQVSQKWGTDPGKFFDRNGWNANIGFTKWVVPVVGMRLQLDAGQFRNYSYDQARYGSEAFNTPYMFVHGDILVNMSNWIGGYKPHRFYTAITYAGFGYTAMSWTKKSAGSYNGEYAFSSGMLNKFRVSPQWDIELDIRSWLFAEKSLPAEIRSGGRYAFATSLSVGVAYRFKQRDWTPAYSQLDVDGYIAAIVGLEERLILRDEQLSTATKEVASLQDKNESLVADIERLKSNKSTHTTTTITPECVAFFEIGNATITDYGKATLETYIEQVKSSKSNITVVGYADKETGSAQRNEQLSRERAENVTAWLIESGIDKQRLTTKWVGDTEAAFTTPDSPTVNRCVIVK